MKQVFAVGSRIQDEDGGVIRTKLKVAGMPDLADKGWVATTPLKAEEQRRAQFELAEWWLWYLEEFKYPSCLSKEEI